MQNATHTPGPWKVIIGNDQKRYVVAGEMPNGQVIHWDTTCPDNEANARLIAAAPALLEACEAIARLNEGQGRMNMCEIAGMARQAIAKALGK